jgi:MarR family transcriptional regulator for hemolysin
MNDRTSQEGIFGVMLVRLARGWRREADAALAQTGLSQATALPLLVLSRLGECVRQGVLAEELGIEGPSLVRLVDLLEAEGHVERREDPSDRRAKTLHFTEKGAAMARRIEGVMRGVRRDILKDISDSDLEASLRVLARLQASLFPDESRRGA